MKLFTLVCIIGAVILILQPVKTQNECADNAKVFYCYYESWAFYREGLAHFNVSMIDPHLCTHIIFAFAGLDLNGKVSSLDPTFDFNLGGYRDFVALKELNPCLKTFLAVGGWNEGSRKYSVMANANNREIFAESVLRYVATYGFDGFDLDWEYPNERGGIPADKANFVELLKLLKSKFEPYNIKLSVAVGAASVLIGQSYDVSGIAENVDHVLLMAYDYTSTYTDGSTGLIAPLTACPGSVSSETVENTVTLWLNGGATPNKLVLGLPAYARTFNLTDKNDNGIGAPTTGLGEAGYYTKENGFLNYFELLELLNSGMYKINELECGNCYATFLNDWFTYDSLNTIRKKVQYAKDKGLAGVMVWAIDDDDFSGAFGQGNYPLLNAIRQELNQGN